jgi:hypothetical protein
MFLASAVQDCWMRCVSGAGKLVHSAKGHFWASDVVQGAADVLST